MALILNKLYLSYAYPHHEDGGRVEFYVQAFVNSAVNGREMTFSLSGLRPQFL
jgi:hypothetical protein